MLKIKKRPLVILLMNIGILVLVFIDGLLQSLSAGYSRSVSTLAKASNQAQTEFSGTQSKLMTMSIKSVEYYYNR